MGLFNRNVRNVSSPLVSSHRKPNSIRLALEALEERAVPAIEVTTLLENTNATLPLAGSLRNAIYFGSTDPSNTVIFNDYLFTDSVGTIHSPTGLALGDFTGSGHNDVVTVSNLDPSVALATNGLGNGFLTGAKSLSQTTASSTAIESGFINADSISDVVTLEGGFIRSYLGNGSGTFTKAGVVTLPGSGYTSLISADLNNDGNLDVATASTGTAGSIVMSYGDGAGNFGSPITITLTSGNITSLALSDVNADGFTDLVTTGSKSEIQTLVRDSGGSTFSPLAIKSSITGSLSSIALASLDTDTFTDAVIADATGAKLTIVSGLTNGSFASKYSITLPAGSLPGQVRLADINGDNKQDLIVPLAGLNKVYVYSGNGDGTFKPLASTVDVLSPSDVRIADMTGDGMVDIVAASASSNSFAVFRIGDINRMRTIDATNKPLSLAVGSFDGISGNDIITSTGKFNYFNSIETGSFTSNPGINGRPITTGLSVIENTAPSNTTDPARAFDKIEFADLNNDGKGDFIGVNQFSGLIVPIIGSGDGSFHPANAISLLSGGVTILLPNTLVAGDFNLDGNTDTAIATSGSNADILVISGSNTGNFITQKTYTTQLNNIVGLGYGDINGDRNTDLIAVDASGTLLSLLRNSTGTSFQGSGTITSGSGTASGLAVADINKDNIADAIVVDSANSLLRVYLGSTNGTFTQAAIIPFLSGANPGAIRIGDITGDSKPDIVVALPGISQIAVVTGNGDGTFANSYRSLDATKVTDIRLADMNTDGKLDIVAGLENSHSAAIFQYDQISKINPVATKKGVLVLNGSLGRLQINTQTNLNIIGPDKFTEGDFANQYKLIVQSDLGVQTASVFSGGQGYKIGDFLSQSKTDFFGGAIFAVTSINDLSDSQNDGFGSITGVGIVNPGANSYMMFDPATGTSVSTPTDLTQNTGTGLNSLALFGGTRGTGAVLRINPATDIGLASGLIQVQMQTLGNNRLTISGLEFGAGYQNLVQQGLGNLVMDNVLFNNSNKFSVANKTTNFVNSQTGAGNLTVSNSAFKAAPNNAIVMSSAGTMDVSESLFLANATRAIDYSGTSAKISGSSFLENGGAGAVILTGGSTTVSNSLFQNNTLNGASASALSLNSTNANVSNCVFIGNIGTNSFSQSLGGNSGGAAILAQNSPMVVKTSIFQNNSITTMGTMNSGGGAIYNFNSPLTIDQCGFEANSITIDGFPPAIPGNTSTTYVANPELQPTARYSGGGAVYSGGQTNVTNSYFTQNTVYSEVDYWNPSKPANEITNPSEPQYSGAGALYLGRNLSSSTTNNIANSTFTENSVRQTRTALASASSSANVQLINLPYLPNSISVGNGFRLRSNLNDVVVGYDNGIYYLENQGKFAFKNYDFGIGQTNTTMSYFLDDELQTSPQTSDIALLGNNSIRVMLSQGTSPIDFKNPNNGSSDKFYNYSLTSTSSNSTLTTVHDLFARDFFGSSTDSTKKNDLVFVTQNPNQIQFLALAEGSNYAAATSPGTNFDLSFEPLFIKASYSYSPIPASPNYQWVAFVAGYDPTTNEGILGRYYFNGVNNNSSMRVIETKLTRFPGKPVSMDFGNIDNTDSIEDLVVATVDPNGIKNSNIYVFDNLTVSIKATLNVNSKDVRDVTLRDVDGDGNPELLAAYYDKNQVALWTNNKKYSFKNLTPQIFNTQNPPVAVDAGDLFASQTNQIIIAEENKNAISTSTIKGYLEVINPLPATPSTGRGLNGGAIIVADGRNLAPATWTDNFAFLPGSTQTTFTNVTITSNSLSNPFAVSDPNFGPTYRNFADTGGLFVDTNGVAQSSVRLQNSINIRNTGLDYRSPLTRPVFDPTTGTPVTVSYPSEGFVNTAKGYTSGFFGTISNNLFNPATSPDYFGRFAGDIVQSDLQAATEISGLRAEEVSVLIGLNDLLGGGNAQAFQTRVKTVAIDRLSPARDGGSNSVLANFSTDSRGLKRQIGYAVDIGAYEMQFGTKINTLSPSIRPADSNARPIPRPLPYFDIVYGALTPLNLAVLPFDNVPSTSPITGRIELIRSSDLNVIGTATLTQVNPTDKTKGAITSIILNPTFDALLPTGTTTVFARYPGDPNNAVSETTPFDIYVAPAPITFSLNPVVPSIQAGSAITLTGNIDTTNSIAPLLGSITITLTAPGALATTYDVPIQYDSNDPSKGTYSIDLVPPLLNTLGNYTVAVNYNNGGAAPAGFSDKFVIDPTQAAVTSTFEVVKTPTINLSLPIVPVTRGNPLTLSATVIPPTTSGTNDPTPLDGIVEFLRNDGSVFATATLSTVPAFGPVVYSVTITNTSDPLYILPDAPNNTIVARYARGSGFYQTVSSSPQYLNLVGVPTTTLLSPSGSLGTSPYGSSNSFTATLSGLPTLSNPIQPFPGSVVQLVANGATVISSQAYVPGTSVYTFSNLLLAPGTYGINARYTGDGLNYNASNSAITTVGITQATPTMVVAPINGGSTSVVAGAASTITLEATVTGATGAVAPSGRVQFLLDGIAQGAPVTLVGGKAIKIFSFPTARTGVATTQFLPTDGLYNPVSTTTTLSATTLTFASSTNSAIRGSSVTLAVFEQPFIASGSTVEFVLENGTVLGQTNVGTPNMGSTGQYYQISVDTAQPGSALINGNNSIYARYVGSNTRVGPIRLAVSQQSTTTALNAGSTSGLVYGAPLNLGAAVNTSIVGTSAVPFTGTIQIVNLLTGTAVGPTITAPTLSLPNQSTVLPAGNYQLQAQYSGDNANFSGSKSSTLSFTIAKANANVSSSIAKANANVSSATSNLNLEITESATLKATIASDAGGTVQFLDNGVAIGTVSVSGGTASLKYTPTRIGKHTITTVYSGDSNYLATTTAAPLLMDVSGNDPFFAVAGQTGSTIKLYNAVTKTLVGTVQPLGATYTGGYRVATGDVTGDGVVDLVYSTASSSLVGVINGQSMANGQKFTQVTRFSAYSPNYTKPVNVAVGDINGDGFGDIIVAPGASGTSPLVRAFSGNGYGLLFSKLAYSASFSGGVSVAAADVNGDRKADIICVPFTGTSAHIVVFNGANGNLMQSFIATGAGSTNGFSVAAADLNGDKRADIILGALAGSSKVSVIDGRTSRTTSTFTAFGSSTTGARVGVIGDITGDGIAEILTASGANGGGQVRRFNGANKQLIDAFFAFSGNSPEGKNGLFIG